MRVIGLVVVLAISLTLAPLFAEAQQATQIARIGDVLELLDNETGMHSCLEPKPSVAGWHRRQEEASPWSREYRHPNGQARSSVSC